MENHSSKRRLISAVLWAWLPLVVGVSGAGALNHEPLHVTVGPHLLIDDFLIAEQTFLNRSVNHPKKLPDPVIRGKKAGDDNFQPYLTVLRDPETGRFRVWYNTPESFEQSHIGYMESTDGINWIRPHRVLKDPQRINFGSSVMDRGRDFTPTGERFVLAFWTDGGTRIALSSDGLEWHMLSNEPVWRHNHDITTVRWDPIRNHYIAVGSVNASSPKWERKRRIPHQSISSDLLNWEPMWPIIEPKIGAPIEQGETQFYSMNGMIARGGLLIGLVKVLRDDLNATPGKTAVEMGDLNRKAAGIGYTVLAWSRDGRLWHRDDQPFLSNDPVPGRWDHAMAWGDEQIVVDDEVYIYYGGYSHGHKTERYEGRQIGLARLPRDRYVAREADLNPGRLVTRSMLLDGESLTVNANVVGCLSVRVLDDQGRPLDGYSWIDLKGDSLQHPLSWYKGISALRNRPVRLEFKLVDAQLFGFDVR